MTTESMNGFEPTWMLLNLFKCLLRTVEKNIFWCFREFKSETLSTKLDFNHYGLKEKECPPKVHYKGLSKPKNQE